MLHKRFDFTQLGGFPLTQERLSLMQETYSDLANAIVRITGDNTIIQGMEVKDGNISDGWIVVHNELIPFVGGAWDDVNSRIAVTENAYGLVYADGITRQSEIHKQAVISEQGLYLTQFKRQHQKLVHSGTKTYIDKTHSFEITINFDSKMMQLGGSVLFTALGYDAYPNQLFCLTTLPVNPPVVNAGVLVFVAMASEEVLGNSYSDADHGVGTINHNLTAVFKYDRTTKRLYFSPADRTKTAYYYFSTTFFL